MSSLVDLLGWADVMLRETLNARVYNSVQPLQSGLHFTAFLTREKRRTVEPQVTEARVNRQVGMGCACSGAVLFSRHC